MAGAKARMAFADPPYNLKIAGFQGRGRTQHREFLVGSGEQTREEFIAFLQETSANIAAVCVDGAIVFMCMDWRHMGEMLAAGEAVFSELKNLIVWNKTSPGQGSFYRSQHELIFVWKVGEAHTQHLRPRRPWPHAGQCWTYPGTNSFKSGPPAGSGAAPDRQARGPRRRRAQGLLDEGRHRRRPLHGLGHHHDGGREGRPARLQDGTRSPLRRRRRPAVESRNQGRRWPITCKLRGQP